MEKEIIVAVITAFGGVLAALGSAVISALLKRPEKAETPSAQQQQQPVSGDLALAVKEALPKVRAAAASSLNLAMVLFSTLAIYFTLATIRAYGALQYEAVAILMHGVLVFAVVYAAVACLMNEARLGSVDVLLADRNPASRS